MGIASGVMFWHYRRMSLPRRHRRALHVRLLVW
jgi:hypothetical protein